MKRSRWACILGIALLLVLGAVFFAPKAEAAGQSISYRLTTLDGAVITESYFGHTPQLLVFYNSKMTDGEADCVYSAAFIASLKEAMSEGWAEKLGLQVILIGGNKSSTIAEEKRFLKAYAPKLGTRNIWTTRINEAFMRKIFGTGTMNFCNCALVQDGQLLAGLTGVYHIDQCLDMLGEYLDTSGLYQTVQVTAYHDYAAAFDLLSAINKERKEAGIAALKMDKDLLSAAMQRAAELSVLPGHVRPSAQPYYLIHEKTAWEDIAVGYETAAEAKTQWLDLEDYKDNILDKDAKTLGVGVARVNGIRCWTLLYGNAADPQAVAKKADYKTDALVLKYPKIVLSANYLENKVIQIVMEPVISEIRPGKTAKIKLHVLSDPENSWLHATLLNSKLKFTSTRTSVATVTSKGVVEGVKVGSTQIKVASKLSGTGAPILGRIKISVVAKPAITKQPEDLVTKEYKESSLSVRATGGGLKYQWYYRKSEDEEWKAAGAGGKLATYTFTPRPGWDGNQYRCEVKNSVGTVYSDVVTLRLKPTLTSGPKSCIVAVGDTVVFSVNASGKNLSYQWYYAKPGGAFVKVAAESGKTANYSLKVAQRHNGYRYRCKVTNDVGYATSSAATLTVTEN